MIKNLIALILFLLILVCGFLFFTSQGVLVASRTEKPQNVGEELLAMLGGNQALLYCTYFTGTSFIEKRHIYSEGGPIGVPLCPRTIHFGEKN